MNTDSMSGQGRSVVSTTVERTPRIGRGVFEHGAEVGEGGDPVEPEHRPRALDRVRRPERSADQFAVGRLFQIKQRLFEMDQKFLGLLAKDLWRIGRSPWRLRHQPRTFFTTASN